MAAAASVAGRRLPRLALYLPLRLARKVPGPSGGGASAIAGRELPPPLVFAGVEVSLRDLGADDAERAASVDLLARAGFDAVVRIDTSIHPSGVRSASRSAAAMASRSVSDHLESFARQLEAVSGLGGGVAHVTVDCRGGCDSGDAGHRRNRAVPFVWNEDTALEYVLGAVPLSARFLEDHPFIGERGNETDGMGGSPSHLTGITHEYYDASNATATTTGNAGGSRVLLNNLDITRHLLEILPPLRLSMDDASGRHPYHRDSSAMTNEGTNDNHGDEAEAFCLEVLPHIDLIRTKAAAAPIAPPASLDQPRKDRNASASETTTDTAFCIPPHRASLWKDLWTRKEARGVQEVAMILEDSDFYGNQGNLVAATSETRAEEQDENERERRLNGFAREIHGCFEHWSSGFSPTS
ncbi:unnamed protein product [Pseudo-nitzschia multistriata]|uniref:Uncharacterized protein n=1 Tax=Pseudo-nitzschia multistriata TaxID=183589 RepID=A0A448ZMT1_9STRA|nr:unnamed protein product [Pseudo-nitzschia multistriata]